MVYIKYSVFVCRCRKLEFVDIEVVCIDVKGRGNIWFFFFVCYRFLNKNKLMEFLLIFYFMIENLYNYCNELFIIGDLNFNMFNNDCCFFDNWLFEYCDCF